MASQLIKSVAEIFQNFTFHLGVGVRTWRWGEKAALAGERWGVPITGYYRHCKTL